MGFYWWNLWELDSYPEYHSKSWVGAILEKIEELNKWTKNQIDTLHYTSWQFSLGQKYAKDHIVWKWTDYYDKIYIIGHSMWWDSAVEFSNTLYDMDIKVSGLYTLDIEGVSDDTNVPGNVLVAENYYQTNEWSGYRWNLNGKELKWTNNNYQNNKVNSRCDILSCEKWSDKDTAIKHTNIDDELADYLSNKIFNSF